MATDGFVREMGLEDDSILQGKVQFRELPSGTHLMKEESNKVKIIVFYAHSYH